MSAAQSAGVAGLAAYAALITAYAVFVMYLLHESQKDVRRLAKRRGGAS